jgi:RNA polymerase sigma-70 factor, ECF subfamily
MHREIKPADYSMGAGRGRLGPGIPPLAYELLPGLAVFEGEWSLVEFMVLGYTCAALSEPQLEEQPCAAPVPISDREIDQQLVERAQRGDKQAFGLLVSKYQRKLMRLLSRLIRDPAEVEDVAQESFIKAYRALPAFRGDSAFYTWLYRIGINTAKNYLVSQGRRAPTTTEFDSEEAETFEEGDQLRDINTPERLLMSKQIGETVDAAMAALPEELRTAIVLRELEGLSYEEIAGIMDCPIGTVRSRIFRAREAIAERLRPLLDTAPDKRW